MTTQERASRSMQLQALCDGVRKYAKARDFLDCMVFSFFDGCDLITNL